MVCVHACSQEFPGHRPVALQRVGRGFAHITDKLVVGLYPSPKKPRCLASNLLSAAHHAGSSTSGWFRRGATNGGDSRGWIEATYITGEKPAKAIFTGNAGTPASDAGLELACASVKRNRAQGEGRVVPTETFPLASAREAQLNQSLKCSRGAYRRVAQAGESPGRRDAQQAARRAARSVQSAGVADPLPRCRGDLAYSGRREDPGLLVRYRAWIIGFACAAARFCRGVTPSSITVSANATADSAGSPHRSLDGGDFNRAGALGAFLRP